ncbi:MAG TPA: carboxypeptidase-like regulatory domain-containing protein [Acidobacteriaceae bacterium]|nr:carboxypeptidase-like regulatory domain-containing protein [Acidobacteriaceae bacterium]
MTRRCSAVASLLFLITFSVSLLAQVATTSLRGVIKDPSGAVVPGAQITLTNQANGQSQSTTSNGTGEYAFVQITPAQYSIKVSASGFGAQTKTAELLVNQPATIDFTMTLQATQQVVNVSAEAQTLNTTDASLGNSAGNALIQALPSETRNVPDLLSLQPGVLFLPSMGASESNPGGDSRSGAVNGVRSDQGNVTMDGIDDNDQVFGFAFTGVLRETQDSVEEFRVTTANGNADEGRSAGAQVSLVTKSGTNKFHGSAYEYNRPTLTVSNNFFNKQAQLNSGQANRPPKLIRNIFGATLGGPIIKDKLFFFGNYEGTRQAEDTQVTQTVPTAAYKAGILQYQGANGENVSLTPDQLATLDAGCVDAGGCANAQYSPGPGPNPNAQAFFASMPTANTFTEGDGLNTGSFTFASPNPVTLNTTIVRLDFTPNNQHRIFIRGGLQKDTTGFPEQFPGQGPSQVYEDNTKGIVAGDTWSISPNLVNDFRYGYMRQGNSFRGVGKGDYVDFRFLATPTAETRTIIASVPVQNVVDNFNWNHGRHDFQFGGNWRLVYQNRNSDQNSYNGASTNPYWLGGDPPDPSGIGLDSVSSGFGNSYVIAYANLVGTVPSVTNVSNYDITSATSGNLLPDGAFLDRHFKGNEFEWYAQDTWHALPNLVITFGIRHTLLQTPYETRGQEVVPTIDTHTWFQQRETAALQGQIYEPNLTFAPAGPKYGKPGFWPMSKNNFAPRLAIAYSPNGRTSIRAGAGLYYNHFGQGVINAFDQHGAYGLSTQITNPAGTYGYEDAPRYTGRSTLPFSNGPFPSPVTYPYAPPADPITGFAITWGLDSKMKTPYIEAFNFSIQHQFTSHWTLETDYVGTMGRHLLQSLDLTEPTDFVDPQGGGDYYHAGTELSKLVDANAGDPSASVPTIQYFEDLFPWMAGYDSPGESATQAIYTNEWAPFRANLGATTSLSDLDLYGPFFGFYPAPANWVPHFWQNQFSSLYALSTMGMSYYNAFQATLRHPMANGLQLDVSYTLSKSIDYGSDAERSTEFSTSGSGDSFSDIINTWRPYLNRGVSDFDTKHLLTVDAVYQLPFGRGRHYFSNANHFADALIGGWQLSGINRTTSGLPFSLFEPGWTTDWQIESYGVVTGKVKMRRHFDQNGEPQFFDDPDTINAGINTGGPIRLPYPGEAGQRNNFRGDGYFSIDSGLSKSWSLGEYGGLKFDWEVYNVTNTDRFDVGNNFGSGLTNSNLGVASSLLSQPRRMQFALRYDF